MYEHINQRLTLTSPGVRDP